MATRPTEGIPTFAQNTVADGVSGQNNVAIPPTSYENNGFSRIEKPPRQYFNWLFRVYYKWIDYFDDLFGEDEATGTFDLRVKGSQTEQTTSVKYNFFNNVCTLYIADFTGLDANDRTVDAFKLEDWSTNPTPPPQRIVPTKTDVCMTGMAYIIYNATNYITPVFVYKDPDQSPIFDALLIDFTDVTGGVIWQSANAVRVRDLVLTYTVDRS